MYMQQKLANNIPTVQGFFLNFSGLFFNINLIAVYTK
jgi:hypothetical protein